MEIQFRPHHFLCTFCFQGNGYSKKFIENYKNIVSLLNQEENSNFKIQIVKFTDSICSACPQKKEHLCHDEEKTQLLDAAHAKALNFQAGDILTWQEAKDQIFKKISAEKFHKICSTCSWKSLGICERHLKNALNWDD